MTLPRFARTAAQPPRPRSVASDLGLTLRVAAKLIALPMMLSVASCTDAVSVVADGPERPAVKISQLTEAVAARYTLPERSGRFELARRRLVSGALVPSRAFDDSAIWSSFPSPGTRVLAARGALTERGYRFEMSPEPADLSKPGDTRHAIILRRLTDNEFRWDTRVDFAIGSVTAT